MRRHVSWLALIVASAWIGTAAAQPDVRDHRKQPAPNVRDHRRPPPPPGEGPREAPPAPREERRAERAGFVWIAGHWDWRGGKWEWQPGKLERERAGKRWNDGRWEKRGDVYVWVAGGWGDGAVVAVPTPPGPPGPPAPGGGPREAPPSPREERQAARAGFVWVRGHWDWRGTKYEWVPGRWERERAGQEWRDGRWERRGDIWAYVDGEWVAAGAPPPPPPGAGSPPIVPPDRRPPREWKLERPVVSSYWPNRGKQGTRIVIRGRNFPADAQVVWAGQPLRAARVLPEQIVVEVPAGAATGLISIRTGRKRELAVGTFEVVASYDAEAEARKLEEQRRREAEAAWLERQKQIAKDRAAREAAYRRYEEERAASRERRRAERAAALRARWDRAFLADQDTQDELTLHAQRLAELIRMREVAELANNGKLVVRIEIAQSRETARHDERMAALKASFGAKVGAP